MVGGFRGMEGMMEEGRKVEKDDQRREQEEIKGWGGDAHRSALLKD